MFPFSETIRTNVSTRTRRKAGLAEDMREDDAGEGLGSKGGEQERALVGAGAGFLAGETLGCSWTSGRSIRAGFDTVDLGGVKQRRNKREGRRRGRTARAHLSALPSL